MRLLNCLKFTTYCLLAISLTYNQAISGENRCTGVCYEEVAAPGYYKNIKRRVTYERDVYGVTRNPSLYGRATRRVLVDDGIEWHEKPAIYKTVKIRKRIRARTIWEKRWVNGRHVMCKVRIPAKTVWVRKRIVVSPAKRWKTRSRPVYKYVKKRVLLRPYKNIATHQKGRHKILTERTYIEPETTVWRRISD